MFMRPVNRNFVCLVHRTHARRPVHVRTPRCPACGADMAMMPYRMPMPPRDAPGWDDAYVITSSVPTGHPRLHVRWPAHGPKYLTAKIVPFGRKRD